MRTFGILSLVTVLAATLSASAAPVRVGIGQAISMPGFLSAGASTHVGGGLGAGLPATTDLSESLIVDEGVRKDDTFGFGVLTQVIGSTRDIQVQSLVAIVVKATADIKALILKLGMYVLIAARADVQAYVALLIEIKAIVAAIVAQVQILVDAHVPLVVALEGKVIAEVALLIVAFIQIIVDVLVKIALYVALDIQAIAEVVAAISAQIVIFLQLCLQISLELVVAVAIKVVAMANISVLATVLAFVRVHVY